MIDSGIGQDIHSNAREQSKGSEISPEVSQSKEIADPIERDIKECVKKQPLTASFSKLDELYNACDIPSLYDAKGKRTKKLALPETMSRQLTVHMIANNYLHEDIFRCSPEPLLAFYREYDILEDQRDDRIRETFKMEVDKMATEITQTIKLQGGYSGMEFGKGTKTHQVINPKISRGYEHVLEKGWDDQLVKKFLEIDQLKDAMAYGFQRNSYTDEELQDLMSHIQNHLDDRLVTDRRQLSGEDSRATDQTPTHTTTNAASFTAGTSAHLVQPGAPSNSAVNHNDSVQPQLPTMNTGKAVPSPNGAAIQDARPNSPDRVQSVPAGTKRRASASPTETKASEKSTKRPRLQAKNGTNVRISKKGDSEEQDTLL